MFNVAAGRRELGKTTLVYHLACRRRRRVIWDPRCMWMPADGRVVFGGRFGRPLGVFPANLQVAWNIAPELVVQPGREEPAETWQWFTGELADHLQQHPDDEWALIVDEYGQVNRDWPMRDWNFLVRSVPRPDVDLFVTCHRPIDVPPPQRSIVDRWYLFQTVDGKDLTMLKNRSVPADVIAALPVLPPHQFYEWDESRGRGAFNRDSAAWLTSLTPPRRSADAVALFSLKRASGGARV